MSNTKTNTTSDTIIDGDQLTSVSTTDSITLLDDQLLTGNDVFFHDGTSSLNIFSHYSTEEIESYIEEAKTELAKRSNLGKEIL